MPAQPTDRAPSAAAFPIRKYVRGLLKPSSCRRSSSSRLISARVIATIIPSRPETARLRRKTQIPPCPYPNTRAGARRATHHPFAAFRPLARLISRTPGRKKFQPIFEPGGTLIRSTLRGAPVALCSCGAVGWALEVSALRKGAALGSVAGFVEFRRCKCFQGHIARMRRLDAVGCWDRVMTRLRYDH